MDFYAAVKKNELSYMLHSGGIAKTYLLSKLSNVCDFIFIKRNCVNMSKTEKTYIQNYQYYFWKVGPERMEWRKN